MKIAVVSQFDLGVTLGIDDEKFNEDNLSKIRKIDIKTQEFNGVIVKNVIGSVGKTMDDEDSSEYWPSEVGLNLPIGYGIEIELSDEFIAYWKKIALEFISIENSKWEGYGFFRLDKNSPEDDLKYNDIVNIMNECKPVKATITLFSIGIAYISLVIDNVNKAENVIELFHCFERTGYKEISEILTDLSTKIINILSCNNSLKRLSERFKIEDSFDSNNLIPGFTLILIPRISDDMEKIINKMANFECLERNDELEKVITDEATIYIGWKSLIILPDGEESEVCSYNERASLEILKICLIFYGITSAYQRLFLEKFTSIIKLNFHQENMDEIKSCNKNILLHDAITTDLFYKLSMAIAELTQFNMITESNSNIAVFNAFDKFANINEKRRKIQSLAEIFIRNYNQAIEKAERKRAENLNKYVLFFTILTLISVVADSFGILDKLKILISDNMTISIIFIAFILFLISLARYLVTRE